MAGQDRALNRRTLLRRFVPEATEGVAQKVSEVLPERAQPPLRRRPPGAVEEARFLRLCTRCDLCVEACPPKAIHTLRNTAGIGGETPVMVPDSRACLMCEGFPCAAACPEGALEVPDNTVWKLGSAELVPEHCLPFMGPECGACAGLCPDDAPALTLRLGRPTLDADTCVGCGKCIEACPTTPKSIRMVPLSR